MGAGRPQNLLLYHTPEVPNHQIQCSSSSFRCQWIHLWPSSLEKIFWRLLTKQKSICTHPTQLNTAMNTTCHCSTPCRHPNGICSIHNLSLTIMFSFLSPISTQLTVLASYQQKSQLLHRFGWSIQCPIQGPDQELHRFPPDWSCRDQKSMSICLGGMTIAFRVANMGIVAHQQVIWSQFRIRAGF